MGRRDCVIRRLFGGFIDLGNKTADLGNRTSRLLNYTFYGSYEAIQVLAWVINDVTAAPILLPGQFAPETPKPGYPNITLIAIDIIASLVALITLINLVIPVVVTTALALAVAPVAALPATFSATFSALLCLG